MGTPADKERLLALLYEARNSAICDKVDAFALFKAEVDRLRAGTPYSYGQVKQALLLDGYWEYTKRRRLAERTTI